MFKAKKCIYLREELKRYIKTTEKAIWYALRYSYRLASSYDINGRYFGMDMFTALLYKKAEEFGYEMKAAMNTGNTTSNCYHRLIFMKPSAPAK